MALLVIAADHSYNGVYRDSSQESCLAHRQKVDAPSIQVGISHFVPSEAMVLTDEELQVVSAEAHAVIEDVKAAGSRGHLKKRNVTYSKGPHYER